MLAIFQIFSLHKILLSMKELFISIKLCDRLQIIKYLLYFFLFCCNQFLTIHLREAVKKTTIFYDIESKGGYVAVWKPNFLTLSAIGGGVKRPPWGKTAISTPKSNDIELKKFDFS